MCYSASFRHQKQSHAGQTQVESIVAGSKGTLASCLDGDIFVQVKGARLESCQVDWQHMRKSQPLSVTIDIAAFMMLLMNMSYGPAVLVYLACIMAALFTEHEAIEAIKPTGRQLLHLQQQLLHASRQPTTSACCNRVAAESADHKAKRQWIKQLLLLLCSQVKFWLTQKLLPKV